MSNNKNRNQTFKLQNPAQTKGSILETPDDYEMIFYKRKAQNMPYSEDNGSIFEDEIFELFLRKTNVSKDSLFRGKKHTPKNSSSEIEISDGLIIHGDTLFIIQAKFRNNKDSVEKDLDSEKKKMEKRNSHAYRQSKESLKYMQEEIISFENLNGKFVDININDFNCISLIILGNNNYSDLTDEHIQISENKTPELPRVSISFNDLSSIIDLSEGKSQIVFNYLRRLQYQEIHKLEAELDRFLTFQLNCLYVDGGSFLIEYERAILKKYRDGEISKEISKSLLYGFDFLLIDTITDFQRKFVSKINNRGTEIEMKKDTLWLDWNNTIYQMLFYSSRKHTKDRKSVKNELKRMAKDLHAKYPNQSIFMVAINVDNLRNNSVSYYLA